MAGEEPGGVPAPDDHEHGHQGSFGTGQETEEHHPERTVIPQVRSRILTPSRAAMAVSP